MPTQIAAILIQGAVLPDQNVTDGEQDYRVIEGGLTDVEVTGTGFHLSDCAIHQ